MSVRRRDLIGRTIVDVDFRRWHDPHHGWITDPLITLDNGRQLVFLAQETDDSEYGVLIILKDRSP